MVNQKAHETVQKNLDSVTGDKSTGVAGLVFVAVGKDGKQITANASGKIGLNEGRAPMTLDTVRITARQRRDSRLKSLLTEQPFCIRCSGSHHARSYWRR